MKIHQICGGVRKFELRRNVWSYIHILEKERQKNNELNIYLNKLENQT